jgi:antitoxin component of MazEF toxin-antitoxin module
MKTKAQKCGNSLAVRVPERTLREVLGKAAALLS